MSNHIENKNHNNNHEGPSKLSEKEVYAILKKIDDPRLSADENIEYFTINFNERKVFVPKREFITVINCEGSLNNIKIEVRLQKLLAEEKN